MQLNCGIISLFLHETTCFMLKLMAAVVLDIGTQIWRISLTVACFIMKGNKVDSYLLHNERKTKYVALFLRSVSLILSVIRQKNIFDKS